MQRFTHIQPVVNAICESLVTEPSQWNFENYTISHKSKFNELKIWIGLADSFNKSYNNTTTTPVFSIEQGKQIKCAYYKALELRGTDLQEVLLESIGEQPVETLHPQQSSSIFSRIASFFI